MSTGMRFMLGIGVTIGVTILSFVHVAVADNLDEWTLQASQNLSKIAASPERLVAVGQNVILTTTNGAEWIFSVTRGIETSFWGVAYGNGVFVTVGYEFVPWSAN